MAMPQLLKILGEPSSEDVMSLDLVREALAEKDRTIESLKSQLASLRIRQYDSDEKINLAIDSAVEANRRADSADDRADLHIAEYKKLLAARTRTKILGIHPAWDLLADGEPRTMTEIKVALGSGAGLKAFVDQGVTVGILSVEDGKPKRFTISPSFREET